VALIRNSSDPKTGSKYIAAVRNGKMVSIWLASYFARRVFVNVENLTLFSDWQNVRRV
jgi:hypothetical protein